MLAENCLGSRRAKSPQKTPTMEAPLRRARLRGSLGMSPAAKPTLREPGDSVERRFQLPFDRLPREPSFFPRMIHDWLIARPFAPHARFPFRHMPRLGGV